MLKPSTSIVVPSGVPSPIGSIRTPAADASSAAPEGPVSDVSSPSVSSTIAVPPW